MRRALGVAALIASLIGSSVAQTKKAVDISTVAAAGKVTSDKYSNSIFQLTVNAPNATLQLNPFVNKEGGRARLLQVLSKQTTHDDTYTLGVLADTLANYPQLQFAEHYVRSVRHQLEKEGLSAVREEFPITIGGQPFAGAILKVQEPNGQVHYRGLFTTFRGDFLLSLDAEAASEEKVNALVTRLVTFRTTIRR